MWLYNLACIMTYWDVLTCDRLLFSSAIKSILFSWSVKQNTALLINDHKQINIRHEWNLLLLQCWSHLHTPKHCPIALPRQCLCQRGIEPWLLAPLFNKLDSQARVRWQSIGQYHATSPLLWELYYKKILTQTSIQIAVRETSCYFLFLKKWKIQRISIEP
jgi:hypothetical protein